MLQAADFPASQYAAYWEIVPHDPPDGEVTVRIYERGTGKGCVAEQAMGPEHVDGYVRAAMSSYRKQEA